jgi:hypothetical protein
VSFVLGPDWLHTSEWAIAVHNYLHAFATTDACVLWLRVDAHSLCATEALELLHPILEPFGTTPFAAIALSDDPAERPPHAIQVRLPAAGDMLADWTPARFAAARRDAIAAHCSEERRRA